MKLTRRSLLVSAAAVAAVPAAVLAAPSPEIIPTLGEFAAGYSPGQLAMIELRLLAAAERMVNCPWVMSDDGTVDVGESYRMQTSDRLCFETLRALHRMVIGKGEVAALADAIEVPKSCEVWHMGKVHLYEATGVEIRYIGCASDPYPAVPSRVEIEPGLWRTIDRNG